MVLISLAIAVLYLVFITAKYGIRESISDTYYIDRVGYWFALWCVLFPLPLMIEYIESYPLIFLSYVSAVFLGVAANFKINLTDIVHYVAAITLIASAFLVVILMNWKIGILLLLIGVIVVILIPKKTENIVWWLEILAMGLIYTGLLLA